MSIWFNLAQELYATTRFQELVQLLDFETSRCSGFYEGLNHLSTAVQSSYLLHSDSGQLLSRNIQSLGSITVASPLKPERP